MREKCSMSIDICMFGVYDGDINLINQIINLFIYNLCEY
mgnify:FL=1